MAFRHLLQPSLDNTGNNKVIILKIMVFSLLLQCMTKTISKQQNKITIAVMYSIFCIQFMKTQLNKKRRDLRKKAMKNNKILVK